MRGVVQAILAACLAALAAAAPLDVAGASPSPAAATSSSRNCPGQQLTCEQLVALGLSYPYPRERGSYLFVNGVAYPYLHLGHRSLMDASVRAGGTTLSARALLDKLGLGDEVGKARVPVVAYGSNANVAALTRKFVTPAFQGPAVIPVVRGTLQDFDVVWSPQFAFNGALPATIVPSRGTSVSVWVTWLDASELARMSATEGVGTLYSYGVLGGARLEMAGPEVRSPGLYVDCFGALDLHGRLLAVDGVPARHRGSRAVDSRGVLRMVAPSIGWHRSVFDLVLDNVRFPEHAAARNKALQALASHPREPGYHVTSACTDG